MKRLEKIRNKIHKENNDRLFVSLVNNIVIGSKRESKFWKMFNFFGKKRMPNEGGVI